MLYSEWKILLKWRVPKFQKKNKSVEPIHSSPYILKWPRWHDHPAKKSAMANLSKSELSKRRWAPKPKSKGATAPAHSPEESGEEPSDTEDVEWMTLPWGFLQQ